MAIHLTTLGGLRAFRDDVELERLIGKRLRAALLDYVAIERRAARESLMSVFWPESSTENARHALRQCLYHLRTDLDSDWLDVRADEVRASAAVGTDVHDFAAALELGPARGGRAAVRRAVSGRREPGKPAVLGELGRKSANAVCARVSLGVPRLDGVAAGRARPARRDRSGAALGRYGSAR